MKNLFLVDGASATGKSDLLKWVAENNANDVAYVKKGTTRQPRSYELDDSEILLDLEFMDEAEFNASAYEYSYSYGGARYGLNQGDLTRALFAHDNVFVIVRNTATIRKIENDYSFINVVPVFVYTDRTELRKRLAVLKMTPDGIEARLERTELALRDYYNHPGAYREVLINNSSRDAFHGVVDRLLEKHSSQPRLDPYLVSVMMSFNPENKKLDDYYEAMEQALKAISPSYACRRIDKVPGSPRIAAEFRELIERSRCVIVDLTESRQNVYYELGYIQAKGKLCVITAEKDTPLYFYPKEYKILIYSSIRELRTELIAALTPLIASLPGL